ncbi:MAG: glycosyltransferase family 4 protein [Vicingaceae bacterium]|nr:glycosyltransferase family 4 protein [Vicingaceae bacterium]
MKICFLADSESIHTKRWCNHFINKGFQVSLISFKPTCEIKGIDFHFVDAGKVSVAGGNWRVLLKINKIKKIIKKIKPDILHAHYATSYGLVGALIGFNPFIITALGSDVLISPKKSIIYRVLLNYAFKKANWITVMADHMKEATSVIGNFQHKITVLPFGIDTNLFNADNINHAKDKFVICSTRNFENVYNIPHLLKAVEKVKSEINNLELHLIGDGSKRDDIEKLVASLNLSEITKFYGKIPQNEIVKVLNKTNVFISVSLSDGNNISLNEAMACGCFPIATNIPANTQWIEHGKNGFIVEIDNVTQLSLQILEVFNNFENLNEKASKINQQIISERADWNKNIRWMEEKYKELINEK